MSVAEIATLEYGNPITYALLAADYDALLAPFAAIDDGLAAPEMGETLLAVRRRLSAAAL